jgi:uncharacterized damage-inducible protein DinB
VTPTGEPERILTIAQAVFGDLRGLLVAVPAALLDRAPAPGEWTIRETLAHTIRVERSYRANTLHAAIRKDDEPLVLPQEKRPQADPADTAGDALAMVAALARRRMDTDAALAGLTPEQLGRPSEWAAHETPFRVDVRFRLHRFAAHLVEHTQQVEKTLRTLGQAETDAQALVRRISILRGRHERRSAPDTRTALDDALAAIATAAVV